MARETPQALQAFEDYWAMGDGRSLPKLASEYNRRSVGGEAVPTKQQRQLERWSTVHGWQERLKQRITEEEARTREEERKRNKAFRDRVRTGIEVDVRQYLKSLEKTEGAVLAEDAASLERMTKLFLALGGDPVADKTVQEHTGTLQVQTIPLPVFGPNDPLNHFDQAEQEEPDPSDDDDPGD
jgi:hypothetical protein